MLVKAASEAMGTEFSLSTGLECCAALHKMLTCGISDGPEMLVMPTAIATESEFNTRVSDYLSKLVVLFGLLYSPTASLRPIYALAFRWVGGVEMVSVGAMSLSLRPRPSEIDPALIAILSLDKREISPNMLLFQFQSRNGWPQEGPVDPDPEHFFHA